MSNHPASARMRVPRGVELAAAACACSARRQVSGHPSKEELTLSGASMMLTRLRSNSGAPRATSTAAVLATTSAPARCRSKDLRGHRGERGRVRGRPGRMLERGGRGRWGRHVFGGGKAPGGSAAALQPKRALEAAFGGLRPEASAERRPPRRKDEGANQSSISLTANI